MQPYFIRFPTFTYSNTECRNIIKRNNFTATGRNSPYMFYPYTIKNELRSDHISEFYYEDAELDWLVLISNQVIDPYYDWYLGEDAFNSLMIQKYGSVEITTKKVKYYRNNWSDDDNELDVNTYENVIAQSWKKYYTPIIAPNFRIVGYKRKQEDTTMNTNRIIEYSVTYNNANTFTLGELVDFKLPLADETIGVGEVAFSNATTLMIQSLSGNTTANASFQKVIVGETGGASVNAVSATTVYENITEDEEVFWSPVYLYEYERGFNEQRKHIILVGDGISSLLVSDFTEKIQEDG